MTRPLTRNPDGICMNHLGKSWSDFLKAVFPNGTTPEQFHQVRMCFYGGAWAMFSLLADVPEKDAEKYISELKRECFQFRDDVKGGRK